MQAIAVKDTESHPVSLRQLAGGLLIRDGRG